MEKEPALMIYKEVDFFLEKKSKACYLCLDDLFSAQKAEGIAWLQAVVGEFLTAVPMQFGGSQ